MDLRFGRGVSGQNEMKADVGNAFCFFPFHFEGLKFPFTDGFQTIFEQEGIALDPLHALDIAICRILHDENHLA